MVAQTAQAIELNALLELLALFVEEQCIQGRPFALLNFSPRLQKSSTLLAARHLATHPALPK